MLCKICHHNRAVTTDCRCENCIMKPEVFITGNETFKIYDTGVEPPELTKEEWKRYYKKMGLN